MIVKTTGVRAVISSAHTGENGVLHGHTWAVVAWFNGKVDALEAQNSLLGVAAIYDHTVLPLHLSRGEEMAEEILKELQCVGCYEVEVSRELEGIYARARHIGN